MHAHLHVLTMPVKCYCHSVVGRYEYIALPFMANGREEVQDSKKKKKEETQHGPSILVLEPVPIICHRYVLINSELAARSS